MPSGTATVCWKETSMARGLRHAFDLARRERLHDATADGRVVGPDGKLYAHATTTCLIFDQPATTLRSSHVQA